LPTGSEEKNIQTSAKTGNVTIMIPNGHFLKKKKKLLRYRYSNQPAVM
jgi:hypothetical protein